MPRRPKSAGARRGRVYSRFQFTQKEFIDVVFDEALAEAMKVSLSEEMLRIRFIETKGLRTPFIERARRRKSVVSIHPET